MRYLLLIYGDEKRWGDMGAPEQKAEFEAYDAFGKWLAEKGWFQAADALQPTSTATSVRLREGKLLSTDGPFAETKEQLGGYYLVDCGSLDEAIEFAARIPAAERGSVEVRPLVER